MSFPKLVTLPSNWTSISSIIGAEYSASKEYFIHINSPIRSDSRPVLRATVMSSQPPANYAGSEYYTNTDIVVDAGDNLWLKAFLPSAGETVEIYEVL